MHRREGPTKGYSFTEDLDLGLLDKQFRHPFALAETDPPPKNKKRRKQDPFGEDDDENGDDLDAGIEFRAHQTEEEREREEQLREERAREARQWDHEFAIRRDVDRGSNALLCEQFVVGPKSMYTSVRERNQRYKAELDLKGVFESSHNQVRAIAHQRVTLAKTLKLEELKGRTMLEVVTRIISDTKQRMIDREEKKESDGLEDVLRAEEQIRRLVGDSEFEQLGSVDYNDWLDVASLLQELRKIGGLPPASEQVPGRLKTGAKVDVRQVEFERKIHELRLLEPTDALKSRREEERDKRVEVFERVEQALRQRALDKVQARSGAPWNSKPHAPATIVTLRDRQRQALNAHVATQKAAAALRPSQHQLGGGKEDSGRKALSARGTSPHPTSPAHRRPESSQGALHGGDSTARSSGPVTEETGRQRAQRDSHIPSVRGKGRNQTETVKVDHGASKGIGRQEVVITPGAPTPKEMTQVDVQFSKKRREIRLRTKNKLDEIDSKGAELEGKIKEVASRVLEIRENGLTPDVGKETAQLEKGGANSTSPGADGQSARGGQAAAKQAKDGLPGVAGAAKAGGQDKAPMGHVRTAPDLRAPVFTPIAVSSSDPLLEYTAHVRDPEMGSPPASPSRGVETAGSGLQAAGKRRTQYLAAFTSDGKELADDLLPSLVQSAQAKSKALVEPEKAGKDVPGSLNPSFASFEAPGRVVLQAAEPRITPRIAKVKTELELRPPNETFYHPDASALRRGTPDIEAALGKEVSQALSGSHRKSTNLAGEGKLLALLEGHAGGGGMDLGPAPSVGGRKKKPKAKRPTTSVSEVPSEEALVALAKDMVSTESLSLGPQSARIEIPEEDKKLMKTRADGRAPAPLDDKLAQRLEKVWDALEMPMLDKLGMVVKYSELEHVSHLEESLEAWEAAAAAVLAREKALQELRCPLCVVCKSQRFCAGVWACGWLSVSCVYVCMCLCLWLRLWVRKRGEQERRERNYTHALSWVVLCWYCLQPDKERPLQAITGP